MVDKSDLARREGPQRTEPMLRPGDPGFMPSAQGAIDGYHFLEMAGLVGQERVGQGTVAQLNQQHPDIAEQLNAIGEKMRVAGVSGATRV